MTHWHVGPPLLVALALFAGPVVCLADEEPSTARELLELHDIQAVPPLYVEAFEIFVELEALYAQGDYAECRDRLDVFWEAHPPGSRAWTQAVSPIREVFVGSPPCYYALRMLTECVDWRLGEADRSSEEPAEQPAPTDLRLTVVLVGRGAGIQPRSMEDLERGRGRKTKSALDEELLLNDHQVIHDSLELFSEYVTAMTAGRLGVETSILHLPALEVPLGARVDPLRHAGLARGAESLIWSAVDDATRAATDWWWVLYPSHVPERHDDFESTEFITGGMGVGPDGASPCFIIDDRWLLRKPPHLGQGPYTRIERRAYLPQWLQHEFFHHLFRTWPEFELEAEGHQWFDRSTWPSDFEGAFEPDYYHEALHRRLLPEAEPPLHVALRYRPADPEVFTKIDLQDIAGRYVREPVENDWHVGEIVLEGRGKRTTMRWTNRAGVTWKLEPDLGAGLLRTGPDNPYFDPQDVGATDFRIELARDEQGNWIPRVAGVRLRGELYTIER